MPSSPREVARLAAAIAACAALLACSHRVNTQIVVRIDSDLAAVSELQAVHVVVRRPSQTAPTLDRTYTLGAGAGMFHLPGEVGLVAGDASDHGQVNVEVSAVLVRTGGSPIVVRAITNFQPGRTVDLPIFLARACSSTAACPAGQSCGLCGCEVDARGPLEDFHPRDAGGVVAADVVTGSCNPAHPPALPGDLTNRSLCGDAGVPSRVFAASAILLGSAPHLEWRGRGFDLDNVCTDPQDTAHDAGAGSCTTLGSGGLAVEDGDRGRDNAFASRVGPILSGAMVLTEEQLNRDIQAGSATLGIRVTGYGGGADDGQVTIDLLPLVHGHGASSPAPAWDGHDLWHVNRTIAYDPMRPTVPAVHVETAYTVGGTLVARLQSHSTITLLNSASSFVRLTLSGGVLAGPLGAGGAQLGPLDVGGWMTIADLRNDIVTLGLCPSSLNYSVVASFLDSSADLYVVGDNVTVAPSSTCNALSIGFSSTWTEITLEGDEDAVGYGSPDCGVFDGFPADITIPADITLPDVRFPPG
ncbi:MAG: hypothetical protein WCJ30_16565 [Deltaproteobacteria bacterium]